MSKVHVLAGNGGSYNLVIHTNTPAGVNSVANSWKACLISAGIATVSSMVVGTSIGNISSSEAASVLAGDLLEFRAPLNSNVDGSTPTSTQITNFVDAVITTNFSALQVSMKFYGYTQ